MKIPYQYYNCGYSARRKHSLLGRCADTRVIFFAIFLSFLVGRHVRMEIEGIITGQSRILCHKGGPTPEL